ncbi:MAG: (Fe-S)-binding protein [Nocardioidaceae bacterium]
MALLAGCAGACEDRAKKTTQAVAELLNLAGVTFGVLGNGETCTGDSARRAGNEFVFQGLAQQNVETFKEFKVKKAVTTCAHCFNTSRTSTASSASSSRSSTTPSCSTAWCARAG